MSPIIPRMSTGLSVPDGLTRAEGRELARSLNKETARGQIAGVRVQAAGFVAAVGVQVVGMVSREAAFQADGDPATMNRVNHIADRLAVKVGNEIESLGMGWY
ncbi:hypothetical protein [Mycobacteroides abscessus]|uniref:hypothetical protein n=1 Tax=Mycobacteroides abscessus TaxID=36809 RepID=UPI000D8ABEE4|nr:hypothetical protein [Mycobacteroides abscessus]SPX87810.1 Uncharacterised protein [Mycobacteroides abscessus]